MSSLLVSRRARFLAAAVATGALVVGAGSPAMAADHSMQPAPSGSGECSPGLVDGTTAPMYAHFEKAHLERSPAQQVSDAQKTDDYLLQFVEPKVLTENTIRQGFAPTEAD